MEKQVDTTHYKFNSYMHKKRWISVWHQINEVIKYKPKRVLEIGPGSGVFKSSIGAFGINVETLDLDPALGPDYVSSVFEMPFTDNTFNVVCAFQMLEHLPFEDSLVAFNEMVRVASEAVIISLPDAARRWPFSIYIPKLGEINFSIPRPSFRAQKHVFDGEHYWEINKLGYPLKEIIKKLCDKSAVVLNKTYRVQENPYHRFFIFQKKHLKYRD